VVLLARRALLVRLVLLVLPVPRAPQAQRVPRAPVGMALVGHRSTQGRTQRTLPKHAPSGNLRRAQGWLTPPTRSAEGPLAPERDIVVQ
jgi:hypothetical protein